MIDIDQGIFLVGQAGTEGEIVGASCEVDVDILDIKVLGMRGLVDNQMIARLLRSGNNLVSGPRKR